MTGKASAPAGAFGKDKAYGNRLDQSFAIGERLWLLAGRISDEVIETELGDANPARLLVQRVNEADNAIGKPFTVTTLASAIVEKVKAITDGELPALVELRKVTSTKFKTDALVLQYVGGESDDDIAAEFGIDTAELAKRADAGRADGDRLPAGY